MNETELRKLIDLCVTGDITAEQHELLQAELKSNPQARAAFREQLDVEAALRTWAAEDQSAGTITKRQHSAASREFLPRVMLAIAASVAFIAVGWWMWGLRDGNQPQPIVEVPGDAGVNRVVYVGTIGAQHDCVWQGDLTVITGGRFSSRKLSLTSGVAELKFDSGTNVILEGPCELEVVDFDTAHLLAGSVVVHVTELSDGFVLSTPEATIIDEGTEYAVTLNEEATEVYVFDGAIRWEPISKDDAPATERIETGEARRYSRSQPGNGARIPFGQRLFVRQIEAEVRNEAGQALLAYDGFENLAGRIQRDRSGFGWSGGWQSGRRGRGQLGEIVNTPSDTVFGIERSGRRLLRLSAGEAIVRDFEKPLPLDTGNAYYVSFLLRRSAVNEMSESTANEFFELALINEGERTGHRSRKWFTFGITSARQPFIKSVGTIASAARVIDVDEHYFCIGKILVTHEQVTTSFRIYDSSDSLDTQEPTAWTVVGSTGPCDFRLAGVRIGTAQDAKYDIDELRIGTTWLSVVATPSDGKKPSENSTE
jgi:ferric-dicitrate binding protein FerR (iron transport regulator)